MASEQQYIRRLGAWRALVYVAIAVTTLVLVLVARASTVSPHMFVIDPQGKLIYAGAIDNRATTDAADVKTAKNYVSAALTEAMAGQPVEMASTRPYGCAVKYGN
jgi:hypothetical protein